jgi:hypothetical protein
VALSPGQVISNISFFAIGAATTPTHWFTALYRWNSGTPMQMAHSADQTTTPIAANTLYTLPMVTPYTIPSTGTDTYYLGVSVTATTTPSMPIPNAAVITSTFGVNGAAARIQGFNKTGISSPGTDGTTTIASPNTGVASTYWICAS